MTEDYTHQMIITALNRIQDGQDNMQNQLGDINSRLSRIEEKTNSYDKLAADVEGIKKEINKGMGVKEVVAWLVATGIALASYFKN